jgi:hypothetical protein
MIRLGAKPANTNAEWMVGATPEGLTLHSRKAMVDDSIVWKIKAKLKDEPFPP